MTEMLTGSARLIRIAFRQSAAKTITAVILMLAGAACGPLTALALRSLFNAATSHHSAAAALAGATVGVLAIASLVCSHFAHISYFELSDASTLDLEGQLITISNGSPGLAHHEQPDLADQLAVVRLDVQRLRTALQSLLTMAGLVIAILITMVLLGLLNPLLLLLPPLAVLPLLTGRQAERALDRAKISAAEESRLATGIFHLIVEAAPAKEVRVSRLQEALMRRHQELWASATRRLAAAELRGTALRAGGHLIFAIGYLAGVLVVVIGAVDGHHSIGDVVLTIALAAQVNQQVATAASIVQELQRMSSTLRRLSSLRDAVAQVSGVGPASRALAATAPTVLRRGIELESVGFSYPGSSRPSLRDVRLTLPAGSTVALVGENGAGKTSLVKLLCGFYQPTSGRILVDDVDLAQIPVAQWRARIAAGFQDFIRYELLAAEAVGVGDLAQIHVPDAIKGALSRAQCDGLLDQLPQGLQTQLGKSYANGSELSGGQWQKLALGRSFMRTEPLLLLLDEPTSALDAETENALFERYTEQARRLASRTGAITLLVSHRFSTVRMADLIVVMADGAVLEAGDHASLIRADGLYAELYGLQARAYR